MDTKTALTCIVPSVLEIQSIREKYDPAFVRWMPHFNIDCFPFIPEDKIAGIVQRIQDICSRYNPIIISLNRLGQFPATKKKTGTLFAEVLDDSGNLIKLYNDILTGLGLKVDGQFHPHVTLARFDNQSEMDALYTRLSKTWNTITFELKGLHYIARTSDTPFVAHYFFPFGQTTFEKLNVSTASEAGEEAGASEQYCATYTDFDEYCIVKIQQHKKERDDASRPVSRIMNVLLIDNSGSMGSNTKTATQIIGKGMFSIPKDKVQQISGSVIIFSDGATVLSNNINHPNDLASLVFPMQGNTNITAGIIEAINTIIKSTKTGMGEGIHYILTFLSDGNHNSGEKLNQTHITMMRKKLDELNIMLTVNIIGISSSNTTLGMQIKSGLETAPMNQLKSVYYTTSVSDMTSVINDLTDGCVKSLCSGTAVTISISTGIFIENCCNTIKYFMGDTGIVTAVKKQSKGDIKIYVNEKLIPMTSTKITQSHLSTLIDSILPKLSQIKVAYGTDSIKTQLNILTKLIDKFEICYDLVNQTATTTGSKDATDIGKIKIRPIDRIQMIKKIKQVKTSFLEERNKLKLLDITLSNDSSKQAEYLIGITKKFAGKAVIRADTVGITPQQVLVDLKSIKDELIKALTEDQETASKISNPDSSILSLNTPYEELYEWIDTMDSIEELSDIYSILVAFGFPCYSVKFQHNNAVQMDSFQTECTFIEPCPVDTSSVMLANQMNSEILSFSRQVITDGLILINPMCPKTSRLLFKTSIYQYLCSVTLCRDLYMYNPKMTFSMHAHSLVKSVEQYFTSGSKAYMELSLRIIYSIMKYWTHDNIQNIELFKHWWNDWNTLTQSDADSCNHPVQVLLMLGALDMGKMGCNIENYQIPFLNMLNEIMARKIKTKLIGVKSSKDDANCTKHMAVSILQKMYSIDKTNSPQPNPDVMVQEPTVIAVRESCLHYAEVLNHHVLQSIGYSSTSDVNSIVNDTLMPYAQTFQFCLAIQKYYNVSKTTVNDFMTNMESGNISDMVTYLVSEMKTVGKTIYDQTTEGTTGIISPDVLYQNIFLQAMLYHESDTRICVTQKSVLDNTTLSDMIVELRMAIYMDACKIKRETWLSVIGDVTYGEALECDENVFDAMIGAHTHGLNKKRFWAMVRASKDDTTKRTKFLLKSNSTVIICYTKYA